MKVILELKPEIEAALLAQARAKGISLGAYLQSLLEQVASVEEVTTTPEEKMNAFENWVRSHRPTPPLSDEAISRESIYNDRG